MPVDAYVQDASKDGIDKAIRRAHDRQSSLTVVDNNDEEEERSMKNVSFHHRALARSLVVSLNLMERRASRTGGRPKSHIIPLALADGRRIFTNRISVFLLRCLDRAFDRKNSIATG